MHIHSLNTVYTVIKKIGGNENRLVVRDSKGKMRLLVIEANAAKAKYILPYLLDWKDNESFTEFIEFFPYNEGLVAVFAYYDDGLCLDQVLNSADTLQRAAVLRSLFGFVLSQNLPPEIMCEALSGDNLLVTSSGKVRLLYDLPAEGSATLAEAAIRITGVNSQDEYGMFNSMFLANLTNGSFSDYREMYEAAEEAAASLEGYSPVIKVKKTLSVSKLKESINAVIESLLARWAIILAVVVMLAGYCAVGVLFYYTVINPSVVDNGIKAIGTVVISGDE